MKYVKHLALVLAFVMVAAAFAACTKTDASHTRVLDFRAEKDVVAPSADVDPDEAYFGGLRDENTVVADEIGLAVLTGMEFPSPDGKIDRDRIDQLYAASERIYIEYNRIIFADGTNWPSGNVLSTEEIAAIKDNVSILGLDAAKTLSDRIFDRNHLTSRIFWELLCEYLPTGATTKIDRNAAKSLTQYAWAALDLSSTGYTDLDEALLENDYNRDYASYGFETLLISDKGTLYYSAGDGNREQIRNAESAELSSILGEYINSFN